jgi:hypothetical protein
VLRSCSDSFSTKHTIVLQAVSAQGTVGTYTDPDTGIIFQTETVPDGTVIGGFTVGMALPADAATVDSKEYIGLIVSLWTLETIWSPGLIFPRLDRPSTLRRQGGQGLPTVVE